MSTSTLSTPSMSHFHSHIDEGERHIHAEQHPMPRSSNFLAADTPRLDLFTNAPSHSSSSSSSSTFRSRISQAADLKWSNSELELSTKHRILSATIGALLTSLVVTPFGKRLFFHYFHIFMKCIDSKGFCDIRFPYTRAHFIEHVSWLYVIMFLSV